MNEHHGKENFKNLWNTNRSLDIRAYHEIIINTESTIQIVYHHQYPPPWVNGVILNVVHINVGINASWVNE
eukprot:1472807-Ditylum_brightwellii.AAC.1